ncbi:MAG: (Fe-S)-binding protein [Candidatus Jordarchaeum sp.]|uniref:(Fe-S)-binding protein n=1 Tax=Candidatus Jordarchaeum sp. TaxID=2823881 RepID=UPI00404B4B2E
MTEYPKLNKLYNEIVRCYRCGFCRASCPIFESERVESWNARGRILLLRALSDNDVKVTDSFIDRIYSCSLCKECEIFCPPGVNVSGIIEVARQELVDKDLAPPEEQKELKKNILQIGNVLGKKAEPLESLLGPIIKNLPESSPNLIYSGCVTLYSYPKMAHTTLEILRNAGYDYTVLKEGEQCCGGFLKMIGYKNDFDYYSLKQLDLLNQRGIDQITTICPMCYSTFKHDYPPKEIEIKHTVNLYTELLDQGKIKFSNPLNAKIVFHDSCHLGRYSGLFEEPRKLIENVPGTKLVELSNSKKSSKCCGGTIRVPYARIRSKMSEQIIEDASQVGADYLVTACPSCFHNLYSTSILMDCNVKIITLEELIGYTTKQLEKIPLYK